MDTSDKIQSFQIKSFVMLVGWLVLSSNSYELWRCRETLFWFL